MFTITLEKPVKPLMLGIMQYLFKLELPKIAIILINIYTVHNQDTRNSRLGMV
jgi:hypothetical protein